MNNVLREFTDNTGNYFKQLKTSPKVKDWTLWEKIWITVSTTAIIIASILTWDSTNLGASWTALISSVSGIICVVLVAKGRTSNYFWGIVNASLYGYAAYSWGLYGDFSLNIFYFLPMQFYGWYIWTKPEFKANASNVKIIILSAKNRLIWVLLSLVAILIYGNVLNVLGGTTPFWDATSTVFSIVAMILMARRLTEQWVLWIIVDVVTVYMWANIVFNEGGLVNMGILIMWSAWLINAIYGLCNWIKMSKVNK